MRNINFPNAVKNSQDFYGRSEEFDNIVFRLTSSKHPSAVVIDGERRIGKTSLLNRVVQHLSNLDSPKFIPIFIQPFAINTAETFLYEIVVRIGMAVGSNNVNSSDFQKIKGMMDFVAVVRDLVKSHHDTFLLLCIDEFDVIFYEANNQEYLRIDAFLHFLLEGTTLPIKMLFTTTNSGYLSTGESPWINKAYRTRLEPFTRYEMYEMFSKITENEVVIKGHQHILDQLFDLTGGHPYFLKLLLTHILERDSNLPSRIDKSAIEQALPLACKDARATVAIENIYRAHFTDVERRIILLLATRGLPILRTDQYRIFSRIMIAATYALSSRGYLHTNNFSIDLRMKFLRYWLQNWVGFEEEKRRLGTETLVNLLEQPLSEQQVIENTITRPLFVFLCYASNDKTTVQKLYHELSIMFIEPWLDEEKILPGQNWEHEINKALRVSDVVVVCLSKTSVTKEGYVQKEIKKALDIADEKPEGTIFIVPLKLEDCKVPDRLVHLQWLDYHQEDGFGKLLSALVERAKSLKLYEQINTSTNSKTGPVKRHIR